MTKTKSTKRALLLSALSLLMCVSMLIGSTFAWFTDSAASGSNVITAGNLDIVVEYTLDGTNWNNLDGATDLFQKGRWEPGHTEVVALRITNNGSLALKYNANMNIVSEKPGTNKAGNEFKLSEILTVSTGIYQKTNDVDPFLGYNISEKTLELAFADESSVVLQNTATFAQGSVLGSDKQLMPEETHYLIVRVDMDENVGNEANHMGKGFEPSINFGINVLATQFTYEKDSFGDQYDKDSEYGNSYIAAPQTATKVTNFAELKTALATGGDIAIMNDIAVEETLSVATTAVVYGQGNKLTFAGENSFTMVAVENTGNVTFNDVTLDGGNKAYVSAAAYAIHVKGGATLNINGSVIKNFATTMIIFTDFNAASVSVKDTSICNNTLVSGQNLKLLEQRSCLMCLHGVKTTWENVTIAENVVPGDGSAIGYGYLILLRSAGTTFDAINLTVENNECFRIMETYDILATAAFNLSSGSIKANTGDFNVVGQWTVGEDMKIESNISINNDKQKTESTLTNNGYIKGDLSSSDYHAVSLDRGFAAYTGNGTLDGTNVNLTVK